jgi:hypothetical protein
MADPASSEIPRQRNRTRIAPDVAILPVRPFSDTGRRQISLDLGRIMLRI